MGVSLNGYETPFFPSRKMKLQGKISLRGPFRKEEDDKLLQLIASHPINTEIMACLPTLRDFNKENKKVEEVKRLK